jgi:hypothetical protein
MSRAAWLTVVFATACAGRHRAPPEPLHDPPVGALTPTDEVRAIDTRTESMKRAAAQPAPAADQPPGPDPQIAELIAQIDPSEYVRWPLTPNHPPALEPAYAIASVFASPGVTWLDLCRMGAQNRRGAGNLDQTEYLRAWCDVLKRDAAAAVARLHPLVNSGVLGMPAAVRTDIANIVVDTGDADQAQQLLAAARIDELDELDLIAASYAEIGKSEDAIVFADLAIDAHDPRRPADHCMRLARKIVLVRGASRSHVISQLGRFSRVASCVALYNELACWHQGFCDPYLLSHGVSDKKLALGHIFKDWPAPTAKADDWLKFARRAWLYSAERESYEATTRAIEAGIRSTNCTGAVLAPLMDVARDVFRTSPDRELKERLAVIIHTPETLCGPD